MKIPSLTAYLDSEDERFLLQMTESAVRKLAMAKLTKTRRVSVITAAICFVPGTVFGFWQPSSNYLSYWIIGLYFSVQFYEAQNGLRLLKLAERLDQSGSGT